MRVRALIGAVVVAAVVCALPVWAEESRFRKDFIRNYKELRFKEQDALVKSNKDVIRAEMGALVREALVEGIDFYERMFLLDIASAMAAGFKYHHGDDSLLDVIDPIVKIQVNAEKARVAELMKWKKEERFIGNFLMRSHKRDMEKAGVAPVIFPHWLHRVFFRCDECHSPDASTAPVFPMKRWTEKLSHEDFEGGRLCASCHDGKTAFSAAKVSGKTDGKDRARCERCHLAGLAAAERLHNPNAGAMDGFGEVADRVGSKWDPRGLTDFKLPVDRFGFIDWVALDSKGVFEPRKPGGGSDGREVVKSKILFKTGSTYVNDTLFDHKIHSDWMRCATCHPALFEEKLGGVDIRMRDMAAGRSCGLCHGKVSFTFANCKRCHSVKKGELPEGALVRE